MPKSRWRPRYLNNLLQQQCCHPDFGVLCSQTFRYIFTFVPIAKGSPNDSRSLLTQQCFFDRARLYRLNNAFAIDSAMIYWQSKALLSKVLLMEQGFIYIAMLYWQSKVLLNEQCFSEETRFY
jgi:hypothetical protein